MSTGNAFKRPRAVTVMPTLPPAQQDQPAATSSSSRTVENNEDQILYVDFEFKDILNRHRARGDSFVFSMDEHIIAGSLNFSMGCVPSRIKYVKPIEAISGFYLFPLQRGEKVMVLDTKAEPPVHRTATIHYIVNSELEKETSLRVVKGLLIALRDGDFNAVADKVLDEPVEALGSVSAPGQPSTAGQGRMSRASTVEAPSARSSVARSDVENEDPARMASVERGGYRFPYLEQGAGKRRLHPRHAFFVEQTEFRTLDNVQFVEQYIPALMDIMLGLKGGGAENLRTLIRNSNRGGVTNWLGTGFLQAMKEHIFPMVESGKLRLERGSKEERVTYVINQHLNKYKG